MKSPDEVLRARELMVRLIQDCHCHDESTADVTVGILSALEWILETPGREKLLTNLIRNLEAIETATEHAEQSPETSSCTVQ